ncbi:MAG: UDP-glucose 4-epimerase [Parcubacteria group bacterium]|nr:MAG: UDP-glucose 4-epimerase [Parcubacteria group bacterium]
MSKKIIVTGGAGFIGSHLVDRLIGAGHRVLVIDDLSFGNKEYLNIAADFLLLDIRDEKLPVAVKDFSPDIIYHLAAQKNVRTSLERPSYDAQINILGALSVLEAALWAGAKKFIFLSSCGVYGEAKDLPTGEEAAEQPLSPYILNKLTFEKYLSILSNDKMDWLALRLSNVYGPRQDPHGEAGVIAIFLDNIRQGKTLYINGDGQQSRDYVYVGDVVDVLLLALEKGKGIYNIGTDTQTTLLALIKELEKVAAHSAKIEFRPTINGEVRHSRLTYQKAKKLFNWQPAHDLPAGLKLTYNWFKNKQ